MHDSQALAKTLIDSIPSGMPGLFNPWRDRCVHDAAGNGPQPRANRLAQHLQCDAKLILVGEAPGYQGCRYSGVAFTSERLILEGSIPRINGHGERLSTRNLPFSEPSATIVWKTLYRLGVAENTILWNALQMHPHKPNDVWSNRTPTPTEVTLGAEALRILVQAFPSAMLVAVGRKAQDLLGQQGISCAGSVRHPANGGATQFAEGLASLLQAG